MIRACNMFELRYSLLVDNSQHEVGTAAHRFDMFGWLSVKTLRHQAILRVVGNAFLERITLPEAVELTRKQIRVEIRGYRQRARESFKYREHWTKCAERACRESQRIRRLQQEFASWQRPKAGVQWAQPAQ